ncbi:MarR family transcriptional regulator [Metabacillus halosaccharovorans]|uniref:MarR family transcriptional regulator n=1 Tax=Metabacillus halosaccharovorans TaxID=930124 RepID=UPI00403DE6EE
MIHYRKILELHGEGISLRGIAASTGHSRQKVTEIIGLAEKKGLVCPLEEEMTDKWIEEFLFPEKTLEASGRHPLRSMKKYSHSDHPKFVDG